MRTRCERLDQALVTRGLAATRSRAKLEIEAGAVTVDGVTVRKASARVVESAEIQLQTAHPYVSRAGLKLAHAFEAFGLSAYGETCLDLGASTGGFVEVLLEHGAAKVFAVDVGRGQLHPSLAAHSRVVALEATDARGLTTEHIREPVDLITADLAFISVTKALGPALKLAAAGAQAVILAKPQFELGPERVGKGGVVKDEGAVAETQDRLSHWFAAQGWREVARTASPILGGDGNKEGLLHLRRTCKAERE